MKNEKIISLFLVFVLVGCFLMSVPAMADNTFNLSLNQSVNSTVYSGSSPVSDAYVAGGNLPSGLQVQKAGSNVILVGAPTVSGAYQALIGVVVNGQEYVVSVSVNVGGGAGNGVSNNNNIVVAKPDNQTPLVMNTPNSNPPAVTKSPTAETKKEGESAVFVARADNANYITWYLVSADGTQRYQASSAGTHFSGVTVTGYDSERLVLSNLQGELDGWLIQAEFTNGYGTAWTNPAVITVIEEIVEVTPTPTPAPTPTPTPAPTPTPTPAVTTYVNGTAVQNGPTGTGGAYGTSGTSGIGPGTGFGTSGNVYNSDNTAIGNSSTAEEPTGGAMNLPSATTVSAGTGTGSSGTTRNRTHIGAYILAIAAAAVIIIAILIMVLYMKGKINLGGLEKALDDSKKEDMFNDGTAYYNPDDFKDSNSHSI